MLSEKVHLGVIPLRKKNSLKNGLNSFKFQLSSLTGVWLEAFFEDESKSMKAAGKAKGRKLQADSKFAGSLKVLNSDFAQLFFW